MPPGPDRRERGAITTEYAVLVTLIALAVVGVVALIGGLVAGMFAIDFTPGD